MLKNKLIKNLILASLVFVSALTVLVFAGFFMKNKVSFFHEKFNLLKNKQIKILNGNKLQVLASLTADDRKSLKNHFLQEEEGTIEVLNKIEFLAAKLGIKLKINHLSLLEDKNKNKKQIEISLTGTADYKQILAFTEALENLPILSRLTQVNLVQEKENNAWKADLVMVIMML